jgi:hypothetical protein
VLASLSSPGFVWKEITLVLYCIILVAVMVHGSRFSRHYHCFIKSVESIVCHLITRAFISLLGIPDFLLPALSDSMPDIEGYLFR